MTFRILGLSLLTSPALTAPATAAIRTGTVADPVGDSAGAPSQDIVSASASYDTNGQVSISATMNGDIATGPDSFFSTRIASYQPPAQCTGAGASLFGFYTSASPSLMIDGVSGIGDATQVVIGSRLGLIRTLPQLANKDWSA